MTQEKTTNLLYRISALMAFITIVALFISIKVDNAKDSRIKLAHEQIIDSLYHEIEYKDSIMLSYDRRLSQIHEMNWENIDFWLYFFDIKYPEIVKRQIYLETGDLTSNICINNHNLFGMKYPGRWRATTAIGTRNGHSYYDNYIASIYDYMLWQQTKIKDEGEDYYSLLKRVGYAEDKQYIALLKSIPDSAIN